MSSSFATDVAGVDDLRPIGLDELVARAELSRRYDAKYVVPVAKLAELVERWAPRMRVLEVDGRRATDYRSTYFDTPDLRTYRDHLQRRRRRFKIRSRHYGDPAAAMLEVKLKGWRGQTIKHRVAHPGGDWTQLDADGLRFIEVTLRDAYDGLLVPEFLEPVATTLFERTTLVDLAAGERITIDRSLLIESSGQSIELGRDHAVLETKSPAVRGAATSELNAMGLRPDRVSKYCLGIVVSRQDVRGNQWLPVLRRMASSIDW
jgi:hypothetical protein